ncbi:MAG: DUF4838 domain-containing protein [Phycisphaerales bacterium]|nr:DUF4838 domain-containing protein [Phycisphaerales bacterium]
MTRILLSLLVLAAMAGEAGANPLTLAQGGRTRYSIVISVHASPVVRHAAKELSTDLQKITGASFAVISQGLSGPSSQPSFQPSSPTPLPPAIFVGPSGALERAFPKLAWHTLPAEGFLMQTAGENLALIGGSDHGTLYAVYSFLENHLGVQWYSPRDCVLPQSRKLTISSLHERQCPAFAYRDTNEFLAQGLTRWPAIKRWKTGVPLRSPGDAGASSKLSYRKHVAQWDVHLMLNGVDVPEAGDLGGDNLLFNGAENFYKLVPPAKYFASHPEYYSLINGHRSDYLGKRKWSQRSELCLSNPGVLRVVTKALIAQAQAQPHLLTLGLSPNDAPAGNCQGPRCRASDARYGAPSGTLLHFVNRVAAAVQKHFPNRKIWLETLAYQYAEKPPRPGTIRPASNVLVCLAPIHMDNGHPLATAPANREALENLLGWDKVAPGHLQVWYYITNFANYLQPFPDWDGLGADMAYYHTHGVSGMFCEGDYQSRGELMTMRTWVLAHLLWNPNENVWHLVHQFSYGYYGSAGKYIYRYLRLLHTQLQRPGVQLHIYDSPAAQYLSPDILRAASDLLARAIRSVRSNPAELRRVERARMGIEYVQLTRSVPGARAAGPAKAAFFKRLQHFAAELKRFDITFISEGRTTAAWEAAISGGP